MEPEDGHAANTINQMSDFDIMKYFEVFRF